MLKDKKTLIQKEKDKLSQEMSLMKKQVSGNTVNLATRNMHTKSVHIHFTYEHIHILVVNLIERHATGVLTAVVTFYFCFFTMTA